MTDLSLYGW